ncbi:Uncharacterised protein [Cronobacter sakazakii]|nr:Uncharacterised protein [Cronobacter sakazakii]
MADLAAIGVKAQLEVPEWSVYTQQVASGKQAPLYMLGWAPPRRWTPTPRSTRCCTGASRTQR